MITIMITITNNKFRHMNKIKHVAATDDHSMLYLDLLIKCNNSLMVQLNEITVREITRRHKYQ